MLLTPKTPSAQIFVIAQKTELPQFFFFFGGGAARTPMGSPVRPAIGFMTVSTLSQFKAATFPQLITQTMMTHGVCGNSKRPMETYR